MLSGHESFLGTTFSGAGRAGIVGLWIERGYGCGRAYSCSTQCLQCCSNHCGPKLIAFPFQFYNDTVDLAEIAHEIWPRNRYAPFVQSTLQIYFQSEGKEACHDVPNGGVISLVVDRTHLQGGLLLTKRSFNAPEALVSQCHVLCRHLGVGGQHKLAVKAGIGLDCFAID